MMGVNEFVDEHVRMAAAARQMSAAEARKARCVRAEWNGVGRWTRCRRYAL